MDLAANPPAGGDSALRMVVGITSAQTCMVLTGRMLALHRAGFAVTLVSSPGRELTRIALEEGVETHGLKMNRGITPLADLWALLALYRLVQRVRPLITDFSTPKAGLLGNLAALLARVPHRVYTLRGLKLESTTGWKHFLLLNMERLSARCAHTVLCNSPSLLSQARALRIAPDTKLRMLGNGSSNGVDTRKYRPGSLQERRRVRADLGFLEADVVLGFVGRLTRDKGVPELLAAFEQIVLQEPQCRLLLVGWFDAAEDALETKYRDRIAAHPRILHAGYIEDPAPYYWAMDLMVLPTHREGFPNAVLEAASSGLAVVTTASTGARDAVLPQVTGLLVPPGSVEAITDCVLALIREPERRTRMGQKARRRIEEQFSQERVLALATDFYLDLAGHDRKTIEPKDSSGQWGC